MKGPETDVTRTCKACSNSFVGTYCNRCGEKIATDHDKSILHLLEENLHFLTHLKGSFFKHFIGAAFYYLAWTNGFYYL